MSDERTLDFKEGRRRADEGYNRNMERDSVFIYAARSKAREIAAARGSVTVDEVRLWCQANDILPKHPSAWGAVFRCRDFVVLDFVRSQYASNHARIIRKWGLRK